MNVQNEKIKHKKQGVNMNFEEEYKKLKEENENLKRLVCSFNEEKLKNAEEILEIVEDDTSFVELTSISEKMGLTNVGAGKIMIRYSEKYKDKIKKGYIKHEKMKRRIGLFGVKLKNEKINTQIRIDSVPQMNSNPKKPIELTPKPIELTPKPDKQPSKSRSVDLIKEIPEEKLQLLTGCTSFDGFLGTFPKGFNVTVSKKKELLAVNNYLIRNKNGTMSVLEDPPSYIQDYWDKALLGEI